MKVKENRNVYFCEFCNKNFSSKSNLSTHLKNCNIKKIIESNNCNQPSIVQNITNITNNLFVNNLTTNNFIVFGDGTTQSTTATNTAITFNTNGKKTLALLVHCIISSKRLLKMS